jgi:hypothetical protein
MTIQVSDSRFGDTMIFASRDELDAAIGAIATVWYTSEVRDNQRQTALDTSGTGGVEGVDYQSLEQYVAEQVSLARSLAIEV